MRLTPDQRKAMILVEATRMLKDTGKIDMTILSTACHCVRGTILYHFGSTDELHRRAQYALEKTY
jgi:hypothetical protein